MTKQFINLRNYTENTFLKGLPFEYEYVDRAKELGLKSVAISDVNNMHSLTYFYNHAIKNNVKPLLGVNLLTQGKLHNVLIYPKNNKGYKNYIKIITDNNLESNFGGLGFYKNNIENLSDLNIIIDYTTLKQFPEYYNFIIERETELNTNIYIELQPRNTENDYNTLIDKYGKEKIIVTSPTYYIKNSEDFNDNEISDERAKKLFEALEQKTIIDKIDKDFSNLHFKQLDEIKKDFNYIKEDDFNIILDNINNIVNESNVELKFNMDLIPTFELPKDSQEIYDNNIQKSKLFLDTDEWYLRYLCFSNLDYRYKIKVSFDELMELIGKEKKVEIEKALKDYEIDQLKDFSIKHFSEKKKEIIKSLKKEEQEVIYRLEYELFVIDKMGYNAYFLIVADYINWARSQGIPVGPGRGSAAGAILAYLSGITDIDPLKYGLIFERFQNPSRISMPDIDTDFSDVDRQRVIDYCAKKYGRDRVTNIITFGTFAAKGSIKDAGRGLGVPFSEMNRLSSLMNPKPGTKLEKDYEENSFFRKAIDNSEDYTQVYQLAKKINGKKRQIGTHACAVIIAPESMLNFTALQYPPKEHDKIITQLDAHVLEDIGLLKMDFLGLKNLSVVKYTLAMIKENHNKELDLLNIDFEDLEVYKKVYQTGRTTNIFQFESAGMKKYLKELKPDCFDDLIAMVSLYRPGPLAFIPSYIARKHGQEPVTYMHPDLEPIMKGTQGTCLTGDSKVLFEDGEYIKIADIVDNKKNIEKKVVSVNMKTGELENNKITHLFNNGEKDFVETELSNGNKVKTTLEHKFVVLDIDGNLVKKELKNIDKEKDLIIDIVK